MDVRESEPSQLRHHCPRESEADIGRGLGVVNIIINVGQGEEGHCGGSQAVYEVAQQYHLVGQGRLSGVGDHPGERRDEVPQGRQHHTNEDPQCLLWKVVNERMHQKNGNSSQI